MSPTDAENPGIYIASTRTPAGETPVCMVEWGGVGRYSPVDDVRTTAEDLFTCAAYADLVGELLRTQVPAHIVTGMVQGMLAGRRPRHFGTATTAFLLPGGSTKLAKGVVLMAHRDRFHTGHADLSLSPEEARETARAWMAAAEATESDSLFQTVLQRAGWLSDDDLDAVFGLLHDIRTGAEPAPGQQTQPGTEGPG
jgi:hypothetical protein